MRSFTSILGFALISSTALALPSSFTNLAPRNINYKPTDVELATTGARECTAEQLVGIEQARKDAVALAALAKNMEIWSPAYRAYFDRKTPESKAKAESASAQQIAMFNTVKERFDRAHKILSDPTTANIPILCGPPLKSDVSQSSKDEPVCPKGTAARTNNYESFSAIILCEPFFDRVKEKGRLSTSTTSSKGKKIDLCKFPEMLQSATNAGKVLLHEVMHLHQVAPKFDEHRQRIDIIDCVYGAYLNDFIAQYSPKVTLVNADSMCI